MTVEPLVFQPTVEGLFVRGLGPQLTPRCRERLQAEGLNLGGRLLPAYPLAAWKCWMRIAAEELHPGKQRSEAYQALGRRLAAGQAEARVGHAARGISRLVGQHRSLQRIGQRLRQGSNFSEVRLLERGAGDWEMWLNDVIADDPAFVVGLLLEGMSQAGCRGLAVVPRGFNGTSCTFRVRWVEAPDTPVV